MKLNLDKTYTYGGKYYGPGDVEVPDDAAKSIQERMQAGSPNAKPDMQLDSSKAGAQHEEDSAPDSKSADSAHEGASKKVGKKGK